MRRLRLWCCWRLLELARRVHPSAELSADMRCWQVIEVPRRISEAEARDLAAAVKNL